MTDNVIIGYNDRVRAATSITGGSWQSGTLATNIATDPLAEVARSTSCSRAHTRLRIGFGKTCRALRMAMVQYHNLSTAAKLRLRLSRASLDLIFDDENSDIWDDRLTKSGGTNGTRVNSRGRPVRVTRTNLLLRSQEFDNASWTKSAATVPTTNATAPDGTATADFLLPNTSNTLHYATQTATTTSGSAYTASVYGKTGGYDWLVIEVATVGAVWFNVETGVVGTQSTANFAQAYTVQDALGYWRCVLTFNASAASHAVTLYAAQLDGTATHAGDGTSGVYLWGAQLEENADATDYIPTTSATVTATSSGRINYGARRENLFTSSQGNFSAGWSNTGMTSISDNSQTAPDGTATATRTQYGAGATTRVYQAVTLQANTTYAMSVWAKTSGTGAFRFKDGSAYSSNETLSTSWQRFSYSFTTTTGGATNIEFANQSAGGTTVVDFWGAQLEKASTAGYYLPTTTAARVDLAPWRTNVAVQSEKLSDAATWVPTAASVWAGETTPPATCTTANKLVADGSNAQHVIYQYIAAAPAPTSSVQYRCSVSMYAKAGEYSWFRFYTGLLGATGAWFNLTTGAAGTCNVTGGTATIEAVGDGWYRCTISGPSVAGGSNYLWIELAAADAGGGFQGAAGSGVYLTGVQVECGPLAPTPYIATTTQPRTVADECLGLLVEEARTNLLLRSQEFDNVYWGKSDATVTSNAAIAPDGTLTADKFVEGAGSVTPQIYKVAAATANTNHTLSFYAKAAERNWVIVNNNDGLGSFRAWFDLSTGKVGSVNAGITATIENVGNGWYRCTVVRLISNFGGATSAIQVADADGSQTYTGNGTSGIYVWGAQLEAGAFPTSYIPTTSATVTRAVDVNSATLTAVAVGTLYAEAMFNGAASGSYPQLATLMDGSNVASIGRRGADAGVWTNMLTGGVSQVNNDPLAGSDRTSFSKVAFAFQTNDYVALVDGASLTADTSCSTAAYTTLGIGSNGSGGASFNGHIKRVTYFPERLKNSELVTLTTDGPDALGFNSGWVDAYAMSYGVEDTVPVTWGRQYPVPIAITSVDAAYATLEINDTGNSYGYVEMGQLAITSGLQPELLGCVIDGKEDNRNDLSDVTVMDSGAEVVFERPRQRKAKMSLPVLTKEEGNTFHQMLGLAGTTQDIIFVPDPSDRAECQQYGFIGRMETLPAMLTPWFGKRGSGCQVKEKLA